MATPLFSGNQVKARRQQRDWSQAELAERASVSRAEVSAIEIGRVDPSVTVALALASALGCKVEDLFGAEEEAPTWAWPARTDPCRYWQARVGRRLLRYPVESTPGGVQAHDGVHQGGRSHSPPEADPSRTLVLACCDPAAGLLAGEYSRSTGFRLLVLPRGSRQALALLGQGFVHVAGVHFGTGKNPGGNAAMVKETLGAGYRLVRGSTWQEGLALSSSSSVRSAGDAVRSRLRWVGREDGTAARACQDELLADRAAPRRIARDHRGVAEAVRSGWADVGVCHRLASEEAGLSFFAVRDEIFDYCYPQEGESDPRVDALLRLIRSMSYRKLLGELPGYDTRDAGEVETIQANDP